MPFADISSPDVDPERALQAARSHRDVENPLHWVLDMIFDEDHSRARSGFSAENLAIMRHMAYNATRKSEATKGGMKRRKKSLTWNPDKLLATLRAAWRGNGGKSKRMGRGPHARRKRNRARAIPCRCVDSTRQKARHVLPELAVGCWWLIVEH